jgi:hypothetical protein
MLSPGSPSARKLPILVSLTILIVVAGGCVAEESCREEIDWP